LRNPPVTPAAFSATVSAFRTARMVFHRSAGPARQRRTTVSTAGGTAPFNREGGAGRTDGSAVAIDGRRPVNIS
jgi:hypothetical protein